MVSLQITPRSDSQRGGRLHGQKAGRVGLLPGLLALALVILIAASERAMAVPDDAYEPDDVYSSARVITSGAVQTHNINENGADEDWLRFVLSTTSDVVIETWGPSGDTVVYLYDSSGVPSNYITYDDDDGIGQFSRIDYDYLSSGTYYIRVIEYNQNNEIPVYNITLAVMSPGSGSFLVTSPTDSSVWRGGSTYIIAWQSYGIVGPDVRIEYARGTYSQTTAVLIASTTLNDGSYSWTVPSSIYSGQDYLIRVASMDNSQVYDDSPLFRIEGVAPPGQSGSDSTGLIILLVIVLVVVIVIVAVVASLLKRKPSAPQVPPAVSPYAGGQIAPPPIAPPLSTVPPHTLQQPVLACWRCGRPVEQSWIICAYCGSRLR